MWVGSVRGSRLPPNFGSLGVGAGAGICSSSSVGRMIVSTDSQPGPRDGPGLARMSSATGATLLPEQQPKKSNQLLRAPVEQRGLRGQETLAREAHRPRRTRPLLVRMELVVAGFLRLGR